MHFWVPGRAEGEEGEAEGVRGGRRDEEEVGKGSRRGPGRGRRDRGAPPLLSPPGGLFGIYTQTEKVEYGRNR